jgi:AcrR family transcriptional regulator
MPDAPMRRRLKKPERRALIEDAASALFAEHGYAQTRLEDIAAAAGVTKQLLYQHFSSKRELHMALLARHRDELLAGTAEEMARPGTLLERLPRVFDRWFGYVEDHPYAMAMLFRDTTGDAELQRFHRELQASARAANVRLLRAEPELRIAPGTIEAVAEFARAGSTGLALWWAEHRDVPRATVVDAAVQMLASGFGLRPAGEYDRRGRDGTQA